MSQFIIAFGRHGATRAIWAESLHEAHKLAIIRSFRAGILDPQEMRSTTWAKPWTWDLAYDNDLLPYEPLPRWVENYVRG